MSVMQPTDEDAKELAEVYDVLKHDAKLLVKDLTDGVSMWRSTSVMLFYLAILGFFLAWITAYPQVLVSTYQVVGVVASLVLGIACAGFSVYVMTRYRSLRRKYSRLFEASQKLK